MGGRPKTLDHLRSKKKPFVKRVSLVLDGDLADRLDSLQTERQEVIEEKQRDEFLGGEMKPETRRKLEDVDARIAEAEKALEKATETFVFRGIGRTKYDRLLAEHPPTDSQREANKSKGLPEPDYNPDSFPPALCAASCISHEATEDEWKALLHDDEIMNSAEEMILFSSALAANNDARVLDVGKGSAATRN